MQTVSSTMMLSERLIAVDGASQPAEAPPRVELLDNAKAVLIICVVLYHTAVVYTSADRPEQSIPFASGMLALLKAVVMPCFCLISGHLSPTKWNERRMRALCQLFTTYLIFQLLNYINLLISMQLNGFAVKEWPLQLFHPEVPVVTWFLLALLIWRLALLGLDRMRAPIAVSFVIGLGALFVDLGVNYQNIASFFPYFVIGNRLPRNLWRNHLLQPALRVPFAACFLMIATSVLAYSAFGGKSFGRTFERLSFTYACFNGAPPEQRATECSTPRELFCRAAFYAASAPLILGFLCCLPTRSGLWTAPGYMSMYVYLLHPFVLFNPPVMKFTFELLSHLYGHEITVWKPASDASCLLLLVPSALLVCALLSIPITRSLLWPLVEPPTDMLFNLKRAEPSEEESGGSPSAAAADGAGAQAAVEAG